MDGPRAQRIGVIQSLLVTCRLQGVDPYIYLVDVLQRVAEHPAKRVTDLTPRVWKTLLAERRLALRPRPDSCSAHTIALRG